MSDINATTPMILKPTRGWAAMRLAEVWQFRDLLFTLAGRDLKLRYKQTALGVAWVVLQPLAAAGIFNFVFGTIAGMPTSFTVTFAGVMAWNLFANTITRASACLVGNSQLISKVFFPRLILPLSVIPSAMVDFAVALAMTATLMAIKGIVPGAGVLLLPVWIALILMLALGAGLIAASLMVSYRDVAYVLPVIVQLLMFGSPVAYSTRDVPARWVGWYMLNPLASLLDGFKWSLLGGTGWTSDLRWDFAGYAAGVAVFAMVIGIACFKHMERRFADVI